ncbi:filamin-A-interacting protein 1-like, partial [Aulostomus maculatus]
NLTKKDLLQLLGIMEGEVQAREDVISLLKSQKTGPETLEAHYGSAVPIKPLQALQRDSLLTHVNRCTDDVYEMPIAELDRLEDKQKETYRRMLEQLLLAEKCHRRTVVELDNEKRKHADFMHKSDDFTNLLEQERERLKQLLEQEKAYQAHRDKDHSRRLEKVRAELLKLKSFTLMLLDERQLHLKKIDQQSQTVQDLSQTMQEKEQRLAAVTTAAKGNSQKFLKLEAELEQRATKCSHEYEGMTAKLAEQESQNRQLRLKLATLTNKMEELEERNKQLQRSDEDLQQLRDKISKGECGSSSLVAELENLRKRVLEMEDKDEEITKTENQCRDLRKRLAGEEDQSQELRLELDQLHQRMEELEKLEGAFSRSKAECSQLHTKLEMEKRGVTDLSGELERLKTRLKELESFESKFEMVEMVLKDDLMKLKSFTVILVNEQKNMAERLKQEELKSGDLNRKFKAEECKVTEVTEKLIEESKKLLKLKSEMGVKLTSLMDENDDLKNKLAREEKMCQELNTTLSVMKVRMEGLEEAERKRTNQEDNKVQELMREIARLKSRLQQLEVVEGDLMKTEDEYDLLEQKFQTEQDKSNALSKLLDEMKSQIGNNRNKAIEKGELMSPEAELRIRCKMEEAKSRELQVDVQALKEKIHDLMNKEDQLAQLQAHYSLLQQRFMEEEDKRRSLSKEVANLSTELEATRRYSRALRPSMNGRRMVDVLQTSTAVQTDALPSEPVDDDTTAGFIRKSVLEENHLMSNLRQQSLKRPAVLERYPPALAELGERKSWTPWIKKKEANTHTQTAPERTPFLPSDMTAPQMPGQPLRIRVTPHHKNSTATLEITRPRADEFFSSTTIIPTLGLQKPRITVVPKAAVLTKACDVAGGLNRAKSPVMITTISRAKNMHVNNSRNSDCLQSPVSIITVSTTPVAEACASPEPYEATTSGQPVVTMSAEKQAIRKYNSNIITTEDNKIHIQLGSQFKRPSEGGACPVRTSSGSKEMATVTIPRSPRQHSAGQTTPSKMTSSLTITPISSATTRLTQSVPAADVHSTSQDATRIPGSKGMKPSSRVLSGVSTVTRLESRAESQLMKIELRTSTPSAEGHS